MRYWLIVFAFFTLTACGGKAANEIDLRPGPSGTFLAVGAVQDSTISESDFKFQIKSQPAKGISIGTAVGDSTAGKNDEKSFVPASITKVLTTAVAMRKNGTQFRFQTRLSWNLTDVHTARDLTLTGGGDPLTTRATLQKFAAELKTRGILKVNGDLHLVTEDPRHDFTIAPEGMDAEDLINCYGARVQAFNLERNCSTLRIAGWRSAHWLDPSLQVPVSFAPTPLVGRSFALERMLEGPLGVLEGYRIQATPEKRGLDLDLPIPDVKGWVGLTFLAELRKQDVNVSEVKSLSEEKTSTSENFTLESCDLATLARMTNKLSDNFLAEAMFKSFAGLDESQQDLMKAGANVMRASLTDWIGDLASELQLYDGAGLSRANRVTPRAFLAALKAFTKEPFFPELWRSLPIAGVDGTLRHRMTDTTARGLVHAKTGTLRGAYQLAGYIPRLGDNGATVEYVPFVILSATTPDNSGATRAFQDKVLDQLTEQLNPGKVSRPEPKPKAKEKKKIADKSSKKKRRS